MAKATKGKGSGKLTKAGKPDGRGNNKTPEKSRIKPREVRNKWGRGGKPKAAESVSIAKLYEEVLGPAFRNKDDPFGATLQQLIARDIHDALVNHDPAARVRLQKAIEPIMANRDRENREEYENAIAYKRRYEPQFKHAEKFGLRPPDIFPHPAHVKFTENGVWIRGPMTPDERAEWELLKFAIRHVAHLENNARKEDKVRPTPETKLHLALARKARRRLMRRVPKDWDWQERIYTLGALRIAVEVERFDGPDGEELGPPTFEITDDEPTEEPIKTPKSYRRVVDMNEVLEWFPNEPYRPSDYDGLEELYPDGPEGQFLDAA